MALNIRTMPMSQSTRGVSRGETTTQEEESFAQSPSQLLSANRSTKAQGRPCNGCRKKHRRCEGGVPCKLCVAQGIDCRFDKPDRRPRLDSIDANSGESNNDGLKIVDQSLPTLSFTQSQLALALSLQKSKPLDLATREYCLQLRKHIKTGKIQADEDHAYIDTAGFWRDQCVKLQSEKRGLEVQIARLELSVKPCSDLTSPMLNLEIPGCRTSRKRKAPVSEDANLDEQMSQPESSAWHELGDANCLPLLRRAQALYRLLADNKVSSDLLSSSIISLVSYSIAIVAEICDAVIKDPDYWVEFALQKVTHSLVIVAAVFNMSLKGLAHLCRDIPGRRCKGQLVYTLVQFFSGTLDHIHRLCVEEVSLRPVYPLLNGDCGTRVRISKVIIELSKLLTNILISPEFKKSNLHYVEVLEGLFSGLLDRIGRLISQAVFIRTLTQSALPGRIASLDHDNTILPADGMLVELEGHTLAMALKRAMADSDESGPITLAEILRRTHVLDPNSRDEVLLAKARTSLQETLLKGVFGEDGDEFREALKVRERPGAYTDLAPPPNQPIGGNSFIEAVYSIVGWETLLVS